MLGEDRSIRCKSQKDFKTVDMFEMCIWDCQIFNPNIYDEAMYVGRIQINLNDGKKRKFLYFQSDYKIKNIYSLDLFVKDRHLLLFLSFHLSLLKTF